MLGAIRSERRAASDRNRWAAYVRIRTDRAVVDRTLQLVHRLALIEHTLQLATEARVAERIAEVDRAQELAQRVATLVSQIAPGRAAIHVEPSNRGTPTA